MVRLGTRDMSREFRDRSTLTRIEHLEVFPRESKHETLPTNGKSSEFALDRRQGLADMEIRL